MKTAFLALIFLFCSQLAPAAATIRASTTYDANPQQLVYAQRQRDQQPRLTINPEVPQFPAGTEWALVRRCA